MIDSHGFSQVKTCDANGLDVKGFNIFNMNRVIYVYDRLFRKIFVAWTDSKEICYGMVTPYLLSWSMFIFFEKPVQNFKMCIPDLGERKISRITYPLQRDENVLTTQKDVKCVYKKGKRLEAWFGDDETTAKCFMESDGYFYDITLAEAAHTKHKQGWSTVNPDRRHIKIELVSK